LFGSNASVFDHVSNEQAVAVVATVKLKEECGHYPSTGDKKRFAGILGSAIN
jgi:hypothetical protein